MKLTAQQYTQSYITHIDNGILGNANVQKKHIRDYNLTFLKCNSPLHFLKVLDFLFCKNDYVFA